MIKPGFLYSTQDMGVLGSAGIEPLGSIRFGVNNIIFVKQNNYLSDKEMKIVILSILILHYNILYR